LAFSPDARTFQYFIHAVLTYLVANTMKILGEWKENWHKYEEIMSCTSIQKQEKINLF
jgi:hypothetical protein